MYKISTPITSGIQDRVGRENTLRELKRFGAKRIFLTIDRYELDENKKKAMLESLTENCKFFKERGFEVGVWLWTFMLSDNKDFTTMRAITGEEFPELMCPTDEKFVEFAGEYLKDLARCGVDIIQLDDDFGYGFSMADPACLCDNHIAKINEITGDKKSREELCDYILKGGKNKYRDAYLKVNADSLRNFAAKIRAAVDEVNPDIRISACSSVSIWNVDDLGAKELAHILAGNTKPLCRLICAPYWAMNRLWGCHLADTVEMERLESSWTKDGEIEIMAEGDVHPRPRTYCPASYLEGFDTAIRASGCTDGILKYGIDYASNTDYETGYAKAHERNIPAYEWIDKHFSGKKHVGVRVYESEKKISDMTVPTKVNDKVDLNDMFFSKASRTLAFNTIPTVYEGTGVCGIAFDENARHLPSEAFEKGLIIDLQAAEILTEMGIDIGLLDIGKGTAHYGQEHFLENNNYINIHGTTVYDIKISDKAEILSDTELNEKTVPMSYLYENEQGNKFLVLNLNTRFNIGHYYSDCEMEFRQAVLKHYARGRQYADFAEWCGNKLPAYSEKNPEMYMQCKADENSLTVGLWNFCADVAVEPVVELAESYASAEFFGCNGKLSENKVYLDEIAAFGFAGIELHK